jgi:nucleotide-binding universal stress UspA family protein
MAAIVVGLNNSETAQRAAEVAAQLAADLGAPLHLVMCVPRKVQNLSGGGEHFHFDSLADAEQYLDALKQTLPTVAQTTQTVSSDDAAEAICAEAKRIGARIIVVGNKRVKGLSRILGSVASDVTRHAPCDVLVANTTGER